MIFQAQINSSVSKPVTVEDICPNCKKPTNPHLVNSSYFSLGEDKTSLVLTFRCYGVIRYIEMKLNFLDAQELVNRSKKS